MTMLLTDRADYAEANRAYVARFGQRGVPLPARVERRATGRHRRVGSGPRGPEGGLRRRGERVARREEHGGGLTATLRS